jgi:hypothetical protein
VRCELGFVEDMFRFNLTHLVENRTSGGKSFSYGSSEATQTPNPLCFAGG